MKKKLNRQELVEIRKKEMERKELEAQVGRDLKISYNQLDRFDKQWEGKNPYIIHALNFFGTLVILYVLYFIILYKIKFTFQFFFDISVEYGFFVWSIQILFWVAAFWSLYSKKTIIDFLLQKYTETMS